MIVLVNMPYAPLQFPCLATGLIKARLNAEGMRCEELNLGFLLAGRIGISSYQQLGVKKGILGEWLFAQAAWPDDVRLNDNEFLKLAGVPEGQSRKQLLDTRALMIPAFLDAAMERLMDYGPIAAVGFSCSFPQTLSSLALVRRIKSFNSQIKVVCGGANFHDIMGKELMEKFNLIDAVCLGEGDDIVVPLFRSIAHDREPKALPGVRYRNREGKVCEGPAYRPVSSAVLDQNPYPDYDDYFLEAERFGLLSDKHMHSKLYLATETSRGCWKGEKLHCTFCGLNNKDIAFRRMNAKRGVDVILYLLQRHGLKKIMLADRIIPKQFIEEVLPVLKQEPAAEGISFWIESGSLLTRRQVRDLADAGVMLIQTGIESLSSNILKCMRKGVTALKNIYFLKLCRTYGIYPIWTILVAVPGERQKDYDRMANLIPKLAHITPPLSGVNRVRMHRFSPYFNNPGRWADNIKPPEIMRALFPEDKVDLGKVTFDFDADWKEILAGDEPYRQVMETTRAWMDAWQQSNNLPALVYNKLPEGRLSLLDTRTPGHKVRFEMETEEASIYHAIADPAPAERLRQGLGGRDPIPVLERFVSEGIAVSENGRYLGLAIPAWAPVPEGDKCMTR